MISEHMNDRETSYVSELATLPSKQIPMLWSLPIEFPLGRALPCTRANDKVKGRHSRPGAAATAQLLRARGAQTRLLLDHSAICPDAVGCFIGVPILSCSSYRHTHEKTEIRCLSFP